MIDGDDNIRILITSETNRIDITDCFIQLIKKEGCLIKDWQHNGRFDDVIGCRNFGMMRREENDNYNITHNQISTILFNSL